MSPPKDRVIKSHIRFMATKITWCGQGIEKVQFMAPSPAKATCLNCLQYYRRAQKKQTNQARVLGNPFNQKHEGWSFPAEKAYLDGLGTWSNGFKSRKRLLLNYRDIVLQREESWVGRAYDYCCQLLKQEFGV